ncbi:MAG: MgtC/SapB family protein [Actinomycetota bacterium]|nr:MgtC/SapB family protein [Actinomycetota bacterium]
MIGIGIGIVEVVIRLVLATFLGGIIGYQRERAEKPAGLRTHVLVCMASTLFMLVSVYPFSGKPYVDTSRIAAAVVVGIGFLGAGAIIQQGSIVRGLTTAASVWGVAAIGLAVGIGFYVPALAATVLTLIVLSVFKEVELRILKGRRVLTMISEDRPGQLGKVGSTLGELGVNIKDVDLECDEERKTCTIKLIVEMPSGVHSEEVTKGLSKIEGLSRVYWEA